MVTEAKATMWVKRWLEAQGCYVRKNDDVDWEVRDKNYTLSQLVEVKGDQKNDGAYRNQFFIALGQVFVAMTTRPTLKHSLALTPSYQSHVKKVADVLHKRQISILWINGENNIEVGDLSEWHGSTHDAKGRRRRRHVLKRYLVEKDGEHVWELR